MQIHLEDKDIKSLLDLIVEPHVLKFDFNAPSRYEVNDWKESPKYFVSLIVDSEKRGQDD